jgi:hypothetical protein
MSEKDIRQFAKEPAGQYAPPGVRQLCKDLLADQPDMVDWVKQERKFLELVGGEPGDAVNAFDPLSELGKAWWRGYRQCIADNIKDMQKEYGIRLTDDGGWEYTEETE